MLSEGLIGDITFSEMGYNSGTHGKRTNKSGLARDPLSVEFKDAFNVKNDLKVPSKSDLDNIWAYEFSFEFQKTFKEKERVSCHSNINKKY